MCARYNLNSNFSSIKMEKEGVDDILKFLVQGDKKIRYSSSQDSILVLGVAGSGKSTLSHFLASDNDDMVSVAKGRGDYIIQDKTKNICASIDSCTVIPELIIDRSANNTAYYDFPGFSDTKSISRDIGVTYFSRKVVQRLNWVKIVFTISYDSVRRGVDLSGFMNLAKSVQAMFTDVRKFEKSACLVVTKVDNIVEDVGGDAYRLLPDDIMVLNIVGFLEEARDELNSKIGTSLPPEDKTLYNNAIQLINILTNSMEEETPKIGIFRRPNEEGPLSKMAAFQKGKAELRQMIYQRLVYTLCNQTDFTFTVSDNSKLHLNALKEEINENIKQEVSEMGKQLVVNYNLQERRSEFIDDLMEEIGVAHDEISILSSADDHEPRDFIKKAIVTLNKLEVEMSSESVQKITNFGGYLEFIGSLVGQPTSQPMQWGYGLKDSVNYLTEAQEWYRLLIQLRATLSELNMQQNIEQYNDTRKKLLSDIASHDVQSVLVTFNEFLSKVNKDSGLKYEIPNIEKWSNAKMKFLKDLMLVFEPISSVCASDELVVKGNIIRMGDVVRLPCYNHSQIVEIFALSKVYFDAGVHKNGGLIRVISPELVVVNEQSMILDGKNSEHVPAKQSELGKPGVPGYPGDSAGGFVGIGQLCSDCNKLSISAVGGKGGRGQDGGDGSPGRTGDEAVSTYGRTCDPAIWWDIYHKEGFYPQVRKNDCYGLNCFWWTEKVCIVPGDPGGEGGNGGDGGRGGEGGLAGQVALAFSGIIQGPRVKISNGQVGDGGAGGRGGTGGRYGRTLRQYSRHGALTLWRDKCVKSPQYEQSKYSSPSGRSGIDNHNAQSLIHPGTLNFNPSKSINQYKNFLRQNMGNSMNNVVLKAFLEYLEVDQTVNGFYSSPEDFIDDLEVMESNVYDRPLSSLYVHSYMNFLNRITNYAEDPRTKGISDESKLVLGYLYTSILIKIRRIQESARAELVIDIKGYLRWMKEDTRQLEDFKNIVEKNKSKANYQTIISGKIDEANNLINGQVLPGIDNIIQQIRGDLQALLDETIALENDAEADEAKLAQYKEKLENQMILSTIFGILQGVGQVVGMCGAVGAVIGTTIGLASTVAQDLTNDTPEGPDPLITDLPTGVGKCLDSIKELFKKKQEKYQKQLSGASKMLDGLTDVTSIADLKKQIKQTQRKLADATQKAAGGDVAALHETYGAKKDLLRKIKATSTELAKQKGSQAKIGKCIKAVSAIQNVVQLVDIGLDIYKTVVNSQKSIKTVDEALQKNEQQIAKLKEYEKAIYSTVLPMADTIQEKVDQAAKSYAGKSHAALDVSSWKVQSAITNIKNQLKTMTDGFKTQGSIMNDIDNLMYGMTTMTQVYDTIQNYYDQAQLADYISDITSPRASSIHVSEPLQREIDELTFRMHNNYVLSEYEKAMSAARQYVFPFGNSTEVFDLPKEFRVGNSSHTVAEVINNIGLVLESLGKYVTIIQSEDENIFPEQVFNSYDNVCPPFYVWKHKSIKDLTSKLFQGNEVMLHADILKGVQENAIKFDRIGVRFKAKCSSIQAELDEALGEFSMKLIHLGNSYYRCNRRIFMLTHGNIAIEHSVNKWNGDYFNRNEVYEKIVSNDPLLSPYGMWKMQLIGGNSSVLAKFIGHTIDIELEGRGSYLNHKEDDQICTDDLRQYYEEVTDNTISVDEDHVGVVVPDEIEECDNAPSLPKTKPNVFQFMNPVKNIANMFSFGKLFPAVPNRSNVTSTLATSKFEPTVDIHFRRDNANSPHPIPSANYNLLDVNGTLLLMDMLIRRVNGNSTRITKPVPVDEEYAHRLAYGAQAP